jgi:cell division protein FtsW
MMSSRRRMLGSPPRVARAGEPARRRRVRALRAHRLAPPDIILFAAVAALVAIGLIMIFSASSATAYATYRDTAYYVKRQLVWLVIALAAAFIAYRIDYRKLRSVASVVIALEFVALIGVLVPHLGQVSGGSRRWPPNSRR